MMGISCKLHHEMYSSGEDKIRTHRNSSLSCGGSSPPGSTKQSSNFMGKRVINGVNASSGKNFTGNRQPVHPMPIRLKAFIRSWCDMNGMFLSDDSSYMVYNNTVNGKSDLIKLKLDYYKSERNDREYVFATNRKHNVRINVTGAMAIQRSVLELGFDQEVIDIFGKSINDIIDRSC